MLHSSLKKPETNSIAEHSLVTCEVKSIAGEFQISHKNKINKKTMVNKIKNQASTIE